MRVSLLLLVVRAAAACRGPHTRGLYGSTVDPLAEGRSTLTTTGSWMTSVPGDSRGIEILSTRIDYGQFVRQGLSLGGEFGVHAINGGSTAQGDSGNTSGLSTSGLLRWHPIQGRGWNAFLEIGLGLLATDDAFPAGGTRLNGIRRTGLGVEVELTRRLRLSAGVHQAHVSNGKGLVEDNPSWEGQGAYVGLEFDITPPNLEPFPARTMTVPVAEPWSARVEGRVGKFGDDDTGGGGVFALDSQLEGSLFGQLRGSADRVDGESLTEYGVAVYARGERGRLGVAYDRQELDVFSDDEFSLFGEWLANDITTVSSVAGYESRNLFEDRLFAGLTLRLYATDRLAFDTGVVARAPTGDLRADSMNVPFGVEYSVPLSELPGLSLFAQKDLHDETRLIGVRWTWSPHANELPSLRERDYSNGPLRLRP